MQDNTIGLQTDLVDLAGLRLTDAAAIDRSTLAYALRRILREAEDPEDPIAAFSASI